MKKVLSFLALFVLALFLASCASSRGFDASAGSGGDGGGGDTTGALQSGNWGFTANGTLNGNLILGGNLTSSGQNVTGNLFVAGAQATNFTIGPSTTPMTVSGTINGSTLVLTGTVASSNFTLTFNNLATSGTITNLSGNFTVTGGADDGDSGSVLGGVAGDYSGTYSGSDNSTGGVVTVSFTEGSSANGNGSFPVSANGNGITFTSGSNGGCTVTGTLKSSTSYIAGPIVFLDANTTDNGVAGEWQFLGFANSLSSASTFSGAGYTYTGGSNCLLQNSNQQISFALSQQVQ